MQAHMGIEPAAWSKRDILLKGLTCLLQGFRALEANEKRSREHRISIDLQWLEAKPFLEQACQLYSLSQ